MWLAAPARQVKCASASTLPATSWLFGWMSRVIGCSSRVTAARRARGVAQRVSLPPALALMGSDLPSPRTATPSSFGNNRSAAATSCKPHDSAWQLARGVPRPACRRPDRMETKWKSRLTARAMPSRHGCKSLGAPTLSRRRATRAAPIRGVPPSISRPQAIRPKRRAWPLTGPATPSSFGKRKSRRRTSFKPHGGSPRLPP